MCHFLRIYNLLNSLFVYLLLGPPMVICKIAQYFPSAIAELRALSYARFCEFFLVEFRPFVAVDIQVFKLTFLVQRYGWQLHVYQFIIYAHNQGRRYWGWHPPPPPNQSGFATPLLIMLTTAHGDRGWRTLNDGERFSRETLLPPHCTFGNP